MSAKKSRHNHYSRLAIALKQGLATVQQEIELLPEPPHFYQLLLYFGYTTGIAGTAIWRYSGMLPRPLAK